MMSNRLIKFSKKPRVFFVLVLLLLSSCGKGAPPATSPNSLLHDGSLNISVEPLRGVSFSTWQAVEALKISIQPEGNTIWITAYLTEEGIIKSDFACKVLFNGDSWVAQEFIVGQAWGGEEKIISLANLSTEGKADVAISYLKPFRQESPKAGELFKLKLGAKDTELNKAVSYPPPDSVNHLSFNDVSVDVDNLTVTFTWKEKNRGDYDRNGEVNVADVSVIAQYWQLTSGPPENAEIMELVDGDRDGVISITDVTPIAESFFATIQGYRIWRSDLPEGGFLPNVDNPDDAEVSASRPDFRTAPPGRLTYTYTDTAPSEDVYYILFAYADGELGARSDPIYPFTPSADTTPPYWVNPDEVGIVELTKEGSNLIVRFGKAEDDESPPVGYRIYYQTWQEGSQFDWATAWTKDITNISETETPPFERVLSAADGIDETKEYAVGVRAFDSAVPRNFTTNSNYLITTGPPPTDVTPPQWQGEPGIQSAVAGDGQVTISWTPAVDEQSPPVTYLIYWALSQQGINWDSPSATAPAGTTSKVISGLINGLEYVFAVRAQDSASPPNVTQNTNTLTATPEALAQSPYPFGLPPQGRSEPGEDANEVAIDTYMDSALVVSVTNDITGLRWHYYDEDSQSWVNGEIEAGARFYHPDVVLANEKVYVVAFDSFAGAVKFYSAPADLSTFVSETVASNFQECQAISMKYSPANDRFAISAVLKAEGNETLYYFTKLSNENQWQQVLLDNSQPVIYWTDLEFTPDESKVAIVYSRGNIDNQTVNTILHYGEGDPATGDFVFEPLPQDKKSEYFDLEFNEMGEPVIAFTNSRTISFLGQEVPLTDMYIATRDRGSFAYTVLEEGSVETDYSSYVKIVLTGADPSLEMTSSGLGFLVWSYIDITENLAGTSIDVDTKLSIYDSGVWAPPVTLDQGGSSANHMRIVENTFVTAWIWPQIDPENPPQRNDFPSGPIVVLRQ